jgi:hypothetical protein
MKPTAQVSTQISLAEQAVILQELFDILQDMDSYYQKIADITTPEFQEQLLQGMDVLLDLHEKHNDAIAATLAHVQP